MAERSVSFTFLAKDQFGDVLRRLSAEMDRVKKSVQGVNAETDRTANVATRARSALGGLGGGGRSLGSLADRAVDRGFASVGRTLGGAAAAYFGVQGARHVLAETATAEQARNKVLSAIREQGDALRFAETIDATIAEQRALGRSVDEVTTALKSQVQTMGLNAQSLATFKEGAKLASAAFEPLESSLASVNKLTESFPALAGKPARAAQLLFSAQSRSPDYAGLVSSLPQIAQFSSAAGLSAERSIALFAALAGEAKSPGAAAGVQVDILRTLSSPGTKKQTDLLRRLKIEPTPEGLAEAGLEKQLERLAHIARRNPAVLSAVGIGETSQRVLRTLDSEDIAKIQGFERALAGDARSQTIETQMARVNASLATDIAEAKQAGNDLATMVGESLIPTLRDLVVVMRDASRAKTDADLAGAGLRPGMSLAEILVTASNNANRQPRDRGERPAR